MSQFKYESFSELDNENKSPPSPELEPESETRNIGGRSPYLQYVHRNEYGMFSPLNIVKNLINNAPWDATTSMRRRIRQDREQYRQREEEQINVASNSL